MVLSSVVVIAFLLTNIDTTTSGLMTTTTVPKKSFSGNSISTPLRWCQQEKDDGQHQQQKWKLAERSNVWASLPDWAQESRRLRSSSSFQVENVDVTATLTPSAPCWTIVNPSPLWVSIAVVYVSSPFHCSPVFGFLAPAGGTTNLCDPTERYQDYCTFCVNFTTFSKQKEPGYLVIQTEDGANGDDSGTWRFKLDPT